MRENEYQRYLIKKIKTMFPDCMVLKNDPSYMQGVPDLLILHGFMWVALEVKASSNYSFEPNQEYYINLMNEMCFASVIFPENEGAVLRAIQRSFFTNRPTRVSQS